jgi:hypothetical protein
MMGSRPIDSSALGASVKVLLLMEDEVRNLSLRFLSCDVIKNHVAQKASGKQAVVLDRDMFLLDKLLYLKRRFVFCDGDHPILGSLRKELRIPGEYCSSFFTSEVEQLMRIVTSEVDRIKP